MATARSSSIPISWATEAMPSIRSRADRARRGSCSTSSNQSWRTSTRVPGEHGAMSEPVPVVPLAALHEGRIAAARVHGRFLALYLLNGLPYCTEDVCTHEYTSLSEAGCVDGDEVECGEHGARFNIKTGAVTRPP